MAGARQRDDPHAEPGAAQRDDAGEDAVGGAGAVASTAIGNIRAVDITPAIGAGSAVDSRIAVELGRAVDRRTGLERRGIARRRASGRAVDAASSVQSSRRDRRNPRQ
jgi:hypothetical protein